MPSNIIRVIGAPLDLGASRRGTDMGPSAIRAAYLHTRIRELGYEIEDAGNVRVRENEQVPEKPETNLRFKDAVLQTCAELANEVDAAIKDGVTPLVLGGDHSIAIGTQAGLARHSHDRGVLWFDAHADINTDKTSLSGNIHGMPVSAMLGLGHEELSEFDSPGPKISDPKKVVLIGLRDVDRAEATLLEDSGVNFYTMRDIDELGMRRVIEESIGYVRKAKGGVHLSFDLDGVDPQWAPGTGTPVPGGMTFRESHLALEMLADTRLLTSLEFVEVNPLLDSQNQTGKFAVGLIASALGKAIV